MAQKGGVARARRSAISPGPFIFVGLRSCAERRGVLAPRRRRLFAWQFAELGVGAFPKRRRRGEGLQRGEALAGARGESWSGRCSGGAWRYGPPRARRRAGFPSGPAMVSAGGAR